MLHRKETRWPGFYYRTDYPDMDEANWKVFVNSRYDAESGEWSVFHPALPAGVLGTEEIVATASEMPVSQIFVGTTMDQFIPRLGPWRKPRARMPAWWNLPLGCCPSGFADIGRQP